ncbi:hypothetical protein V1525DRAFT_349316 [Lipomyces kononenkoae]|uniref:Uncharacterized protein n=1 Tax=Lipomyces kononenkoae TaxID=34357 RepID=A0ACC3STD4_LIPKO
MVNKTTDIGCDKEIELAIRAIPSEDIKNYIRREWQSRKKMWAMFARQHSPLLLQVSTKNAVEAFHRIIKFGLSSSTKKSKFGFLGLVAHLDTICTKIEEDARRTEENFRTTHFKEAGQCPELKTFPVPIQKLMEKMMNLSNEPEFIDPNEVECDSTFYRQYLLPCRHIFLAHLHYGVLTPEKWQTYAFMFEESGFEIYESVTNEYVHNGIYDEIGAPERRALSCKEILENLRSIYYELKENLMEQLGPDETARMMHSWLESLRRSSLEYLDTDFLA